MKNTIRSFALIACGALALLAQGPPDHAQGPFSNPTDNPARTAFVARFDCAGAFVDCTTQTIIPAGHRMVIETMSIYVSHNHLERPFAYIGTALESSPVSDSRFSIIPAYVYDQNGIAFSVGTQIVRLYSDVLPTVRIQVAGIGYVSISGYFIKK